MYCVRGTDELLPTSRQAVARDIDVGSVNDCGKPNCRSISAGEKCLTRAASRKYEPVLFIDLP